MSQLQWEIDQKWYGLSPAKGNPCLWAVVHLVAEAAPPSRKGSDLGKKGGGCRFSVQPHKPLELLGGFVTCVDDLLLAMPDQHLRPVVDLLLRKHVMKQSGCLPKGPQCRDQQVGLLGCQITRDLTGMIHCDQEKCILHCMHENSFVDPVSQ